VGAGYCLDRIYVGKDALCLHNPATGREYMGVPHTIESVVAAEGEEGRREMENDRSKKKKKNIVVIGGGVAGEMMRICILELIHTVLVVAGPRRRIYSNAHSPKKGMHSH
jgi:hypothetical protein